MDALALTLPAFCLGVLVGLVAMWLAVVVSLTLAREER
jgi:hypothetical protein